MIRTFYYDIILFSKKYGMVSHYKVTIERRLVTFWPETQFVTRNIIEGV